MYTRSRLSTTTHAGLRGARRHWIAIGVPVAILLILIYALAFLTDEPLRRYTETKMNYTLKRERALASPLVGAPRRRRRARTTTVYLNLPQARKEITDPTPVKERGWRDALETIYPLKINHFEIRGGDITYERSREAPQKSVTRGGGH